MAPADQELDSEMDRVYEEYGKPLEAEHWGEFAAISVDGSTILGPTLLEVVQKASETVNQSVFIYKIGPRAVGRL